MLKSKVSFIGSWSSIATVSFLCFYAAQMLNIVSDTPVYAEEYVNAYKKAELVAPNEINNKVTNMVTIETSMGTIKLELDPKNAPKTVENFEKLAKSGFYNGTKFHRVIKDFMIQGGDPLSKDDSMINRWGTGGPGYKFNDELTGGEKYTRGILAMANSGPNTNGSQFFIMQKDVPLQPNYTVFGHVTSGIEVVDKIANVQTYLPGQLDRPLEAIVIKSVSIQ